MSKPDLGRIIAQTMAAPVEGRTIETITDEILELKQTAGEAILEIGNRLIEAQSMLSHGEWLTWLTERVEFSPRTAQRFMRLSREWSNATALSHLGATKALALLALVSIAPSVPASSVSPLVQVASYFSATSTVQ